MATAATAGAQFNSWWGRQTVGPGRVGLWQLGPLTVWIQHQSGHQNAHQNTHQNNHQWRVSWKTSGDWLDSRVRIVANSVGEIPGPETQQVNCVFGANAHPDLIFAPALADRSVVTRLQAPLQVLPDETATLYVLSPLHLRIETPEPSRLLQEIATSRFSDTWFGPVSSTGELAYASPTPAYLDLREVPIRLQCAISAVSIRNSGSDCLRLDRINVPLPRLSLFYSPRTGFWTDALSLERGNDDELASLKLERQPPPEASPSQFVTGPRRPAPESNSVVRAFSAFFRERSLP